MLTTASGQGRIFSAAAAANGCQEQRVHKPLQKVRARSCPGAGQVTPTRAAPTLHTRTTPTPKTENMIPVIVVDPGSEVDPVHPSATCQVRKCPTCTAAGHRSHGELVIASGRPVEMHV